MNKTKVSERQRVDWDTVGRLIDHVWKDLEPDVRKRFDGLVEIGIDETSYRKGHSYITTVVNHRTNTIVWALDGVRVDAWRRALAKLAEIHPQLCLKSQLKWRLKFGK